MPSLECWPCYYNVGMLECYFNMLTFTICYFLSLWFLLFYLHFRVARRGCLLSLHLLYGTIDMAYSITILLIS